MVSIVEQMTRIIQWLGGEQASECCVLARRTPMEFPQQTVSTKVCPRPN